MNNRIVSLVDSVFQHHPANYHDGEPPKFADAAQQEDDLAPPTREWVSWRFYNEHYCKSKLSKDHDGQELSEYTLFDQISDFHPQQSRNELFFLVGEVGSGKSSLLNKAITTTLRDLQKKKKFWFIRYNVHVLQDKSLTLSRLLHGLSEKLIRIIERLPRQIEIGDMELGLLASHKLSLQSSIESEDKSLSKANFVRAVKGISAALGRRPLIILDNLDTFFHTKDRYLFVRKDDTGELSELSDILNIVDEFYHGQSDLGDIGSNVVFVVRPDTYDILASSRSVYKGTENCFTGNRHLFSLIAPDWEEVVEMRLGLLREVISSIRNRAHREEAQKALAMIIRELEDVSTGAGPLLRQLRKLTNFGLRDILEFISDYTWLPSGPDHEQMDLTGRYISHYPVGLMAFILKNKKLYSEERSRFPNIFSCNISEEEGRHIEDIAPTKFGDSSINLAKLSETLSGVEGISPQELEKVIALAELGVKSSKQAWSLHGHSYWIKYLLLSFIMHRNRTGQAVKFGDIYDTFCGEPGQPNYSAKHVRAMLGTLAEHDRANLIQVGRQLSADKTALQNSEIHVTPRAEQCMESLFDRFFYLQLIVDDPDLPLPRSCNSVFAINDDRDYSYLAAEGHDYGRLTGQMIAHKAHLVLKLLAILDNALYLEKIRYSDAFERMAREGIKIVGEGDFLTAVLDQFSALRKTSNFRSIKSLTREEAIKTYNEYRERTKAALEAAYGLA